MISKDGYKTITREIKPARKATTLWNIPVGIAASVPFYANIGDNRDGGQGTRSVIAFGVMMVTPLVLLGVDKLTGSNFKSYPDDIKFLPVKLPPLSAGPNQYPIGCPNVNIRLKIGDKIGSVLRNGEKVSDIHWENTVNVKAEELEVIANNQLKDLGFNVPKEINGRGFAISAEVSAINITKNMVRWVYQTECKLTTRWTLKNAATDEVLKTETIESFSTEQSDNINTVFFSAFDNSFLTFLSGNSTVYEAVARQAQTVVASAFETVSLALPAADGKATIADFVKSVVTIEAEGNGHGSGFFISEDGYILTNHHVVKNSKKVNVILQGGLSFIGDVVRTDATADVALVKLNGQGFRPMRLAGNDAEAGIGLDVLAIGTPTDKTLSQTVTKGIISGNRLIDGMAYIQSDVSVSPGSSGGPMINKNGLVVGMITSKMVNKGVEGISFALPSSKILEALKLQYKQ